MVSASLSMFLSRPDIIFSLSDLGLIRRREGDIRPTESNMVEVEDREKDNS